MKTNDHTYYTYYYCHSIGVLVTRNHDFGILVGDEMTIIHIGDSNYYKLQVVISNTDTNRFNRIIIFDQYSFRTGERRRRINNNLANLLYLY